uniref:Uncharacterized protein n=1 Tax=Anguilla anguilla TaxID=7936 RepID=A0A0E9RPD5_ANGAN
MNECITDRQSNTFHQTKKNPMNIRQKSIIKMTVTLRRKPNNVIKAISILLTEETK